MTTSMSSSASRSILPGPRGFFKSAGDQFGDAVPVDRAVEVVLQQTDRLLGQPVELRDVRPPGGPLRIELGGLGEQCVVCPVVGEIPVGVGEVDPERCHAGDVAVAGFVAGEPVARCRHCDVPEADAVLVGEFADKCGQWHPGRQNR